MTLLPWQERLAERIRARVEESRLPHALLVTGPQGWGELVLANWLALYLLSVDPSGDASALAHPDLRWIVPEGAVIKVDAMRELVEFVQRTTRAGSRKVAVIVDAHYLNRSAANALLKTLEEPPAGTHLLLPTCHPGRLPATIRSRCQPLVIRPDRAMAARWLEDNVVGDDLERRMFEHGGAPVAVLSGLERGESLLDGVLARALEAHGGAEVVKALLEPDLAGALGRWHRYVQALAAGQWTLEGLGQVNPRALLEFAAELTWARRQLVTSNSANERLLAERVVARWRQLGRAAA